MNIYLCAILGPLWFKKKHPTSFIKLWALAAYSWAQTHIGNHILDWVVVRNDKSLITYDEVATCKIGSLLCSWDSLLLKNFIVFFFFFFDIKFQNGAHLKKGIFLTYFSHFLVTREKLQKFLQHISHSHTYTYFAHPIDFFCLNNFEKNTNLSGMVSLWYESWCWFLFAPFWNNQ